MKKEFWEDWKNITKIEKAAIKSVKARRKILLSNIPKDKIIAIYVRGSFIMREMNSKSDIDFMVIVREVKLLNKLRSLQVNIGKNIILQLVLQGILYRN